METEKRIVFPQDLKIYGTPLKVDIFKWAEVSDGYDLDEAFSWYFTEEEAAANCPSSVDREDFTILKEELLIPDMWNLFDYTYIFMRDLEVFRPYKPCHGCEGVTHGLCPDARMSDHRNSCLVVDKIDEDRHMNSALTHDSATFCFRLFKVVREKIGFPIEGDHTCCDFCEYAYLKRFYPRAILKEYYAELDVPYLMRCALTPCYVEAKKQCEEV